MAALPKSELQAVPFSRIREYAYCWVRASHPEVRGEVMLKVQKITPVPAGMCVSHDPNMHYALGGQPKRLTELNAICFEYNRETRRMDHQYFFVRPEELVSPTTAF